LRVPWTARKSNQSILKEINLEYSLERLMLKLKLQYFGHLMRRTDSPEKTLMLGKIEGRRRRGRQRMRWLGGTTDSMDRSLSYWRTGKPAVLQSPSAMILEPKKIKSVTVSIVSPSICHEMMGQDAMIFVF